ncbi:hypothetical protein C8E89_12863 [Mycolicibacterium moriokaense]|uniref:Uncharacterized protein n=1 Tax=Mycolicibacterium moriokaense TaxID=39691 RepID=A0A318H821_9MYCO|nr:hypothetical protein C8E89_12863 [Mycolicibacterium moriokaense]
MTEPPEIQVMPRSPGADLEASSRRGDCSQRSSSCPVSSTAPATGNLTASAGLIIQMDVDAEVAEVLCPPPARGRMRRRQCGRPLRLIANPCPRSSRSVRKSVQASPDWLRRGRPPNNPTVDQSANITTTKEPRRPVFYTATGTRPSYLVITSKAIQFPNPVSESQLRCRMDVGSDINVKIIRLLKSCHLWPQQC